MVGNVFFVIIPAHWELVRAKEAGREPDPRGERAREAALGAQQLPDAARRLHDAVEPFSVHLRAQLRLAHPRRPARDRSVGPALLQPAPHGPHRVVDPGERGRCDRGARDPDPAAERVRGGDGRGAVRAGREHRRTVAAPPATPTIRRRSTPRRAASSSTLPRRSRRRRQAIEQQAVQTKAMPLGNVTGMTQAERDVLGRWIAQGAKIP